jgi:hypothetical protein
MDVVSFFLFTILFLPFNEVLFPLQVYVRYLETQIFIHLYSAAQMITTITDDENIYYRSSLVWVVHDRGDVTIEWHLVF